MRRRIEREEEWRLLRGKKRRGGKEREWSEKLSCKRESREAQGRDRWVNVQQMLRVCVCVHVWVIGCLVAPHGNAASSAHRISDASTPTPKSFTHTGRMRYTERSIHTNYTHSVLHTHTFSKISIRLNTLLDLTHWGYYESWIWLSKVIFGN